jgi:hypothetical protein
MYTQKINDTQYYKFTNDSGTVLVTESEDKDGNPVLKEKYLANFCPDIKLRLKVKEGDSTAHIAKCNLLIAGGKPIEDVEIPLREPKKGDWVNNIDSRCIVNPDVTKAAEHLANIVSLSYHDLKERAPLATATITDRNHLYIVEGIPVYHVGDRMIYPDGFDDLENKPNIIFKPLKNTRLAIDADCTEREAYAGLMRIVNLSNIGELLFSLNLMYVLRDAFVEIGLTPKCSGIIHAKTGWKKTTYGNFCSHIYNRDKPLEPPTRLDSTTPAAVYRLYERDNCLTMLDDLIEQSQFKTMHEIIRVCGDGIEPGRMRGYKLAKAPPKTSLLATGEFNYGNGSDAARLLSLKFDAPIDGERLAVCQREPLMLSTFYGYCIRWYLTKYDKVCGLLREWFKVYRNTKPSVHPRLEETRFCFESTFKLFLTYCADKGFISEGDAINKNNAFQRQLSGIIKEQNIRANDNPNDPDRKPKDVDYLQIMRFLHKNNRFCLIENAKDFSLTDDDGVNHGEFVCFRKEKLLEKIQSIEPAADIDDVIKHLLKRLALKPDKDSVTRKLHGSKRRFLFVRRCML